MVETLMAQVKGKGKASEPTLEASWAGGGNPTPPPRQGAAEAPGGGDPDDEPEGSGRKPDENRKRRWNERCIPQPEADYDAYDDAPFATQSRIMTEARGQETKVAAEPAALFKNERHQDIHMWVLICMYLVSRNSWQWEGETQQIR